VAGTISRGHIDYFLIWKDLVAGTIAGVSGIMVGQPADTVKVRVRVRITVRVRVRAQVLIHRHPIL